MDTVKLLRWLRAEVFKTHRQGKIKTITLHHVIGEKLGHEILSLEIPPTFDESWLSEVILEIEQTTQGDADELGGMQRYCLLVYRNSERSSGRFPFRVAGHEESAEEMLSEPATAQGLLSQLMRHNEINSKTALQAVAQVLTMQHRTIEEQGSQLRHHVSQQIEMVRLIEELHSAKHERELSMRKAESQERFANDAMDKAMLLLPSIVNKLAGQKLLPERSTPEVETLRAFLSSLKQEQWNHIMSGLSKEQQIALGSFLDILGNKAEDVQ